MANNPSSLAPDQLYDARQVVAILRVSDATLRRWAAAGHLPPPHQVGRATKRLWRGRDLLAFIDGAPRHGAFVRDAAPINAPR